MRARIPVVVAMSVALVATVFLSACGNKEERASQRPAPKTATAPVPAASEPVKAFEVGNVYGIKKGAKAPTFTLDRAATITGITDYHYIDGGGPTPGTIGLKGADGKIYGPWSTTGLDGQGGVKNAFWDAKPNAQVPAGTYTVVDSDPGTWSTNDKAKGLGFVTVWVTYAK